VGPVLLRTEGDRARAHAVGELLAGPDRDQWILRETRLLWQRVLRRLDATARSFFAVVDAKSCFAGPLFELLLATHRTYLRVAVEERASLSPDALTGMEASFRFAGPETLATKIFGRLSAWQNWIFIRPNATGETGALTLYGKPERPRFDWRRT